MTAKTAPAIEPITLPVEEWPPLSGKPRPSPEDPFYRPPSGWENTLPGSLLRRRKVRIALFGIVPVRLQAWHLLYRTTDLHGAPETTVTTMLVPRDAHETSPVLAYQCAIDAVSPRAFPSYGLLPHTFGLNQTQNELLLMVAALARGWVVSVSDHEGPQGLWMVARQPGYHVLDGVRATLNASGTHGIPQLPADAPVGFWGYSGGGTASTWAAEMAPVYAPELNVAGALLGAPAAQPGALVRKHSGRFASGLIPPVLAAMMRAHPSAREFLGEHLNRRGRQIITKAAEVGLVESALRWPFKNFDTLVDRPVEELMNVPEISTITDEMRLGQRTPSAPVYLYHAVHDQLLPITASDKLAHDYIAGGTHVTYRRDRTTEHILLAVLGGSDALGWLAARLAGRPLPPEPDVRTVISTSLTFRAARSQLRWQSGILKLFLGRL